MAVRLESSFSPLRSRVAAGGGLSKPSVVSMPSPNQSSRPGGPNDISAIVLHHTAGGGTAQGTGRYFQNSASQVSSHYIVGKDGTIVQSVPDGKRAWHAGTSSFKGRDDVNDFSIGIEIVNWGNGSDPYTDAQYNALINLVAWLCKTYKMSFDRITGHKDVALPRGRKVDPSSNFDWARVRKGVEAKLNGSSAPAPAPTPAAAPSAPKGDQWLYTVRTGDTLSKIARDHLGDANRWREIFDLNRDKISNANLIYPGQVLKIPARSANKPAPAPKPTVPPVKPPVKPTPPVAQPPAPKPPVKPTPPATPAPSLPGVGDLSTGLRLGGAVMMNYLESGAGHGGIAAGILAPGVTNGVRGFFSGIVQSLPGLLKRNFLTAALFSAVSNGMDLFKHRVTGKQAAAGFAADTVAYTGIGATSTAIGAAVGSLLGPLGTIGGMLVGSMLGVGLGWLYEKFARAKFVGAIGDFLGK